MKVNPSLISTLSCTGFLFAAQACIASQVVVPLNAVNNYSSVPNTHAKQYLIQAGVFDVQANAQNYVEDLKAKTSTPVRIVPKYHVMVGPFNNVATMKKVGRQLSHAKPGAHRSAAKHVYANHKQSPSVAHHYKAAHKPIAKPTAAQTKQQLAAARKANQNSNYAMNSSSVVPVPVRAANNNGVPSATPRTYSTTYPKPAYVGQVWKDMEQPVALYQTGPYFGASIGLQAATSGYPSWYRGLQGTLSAGLGHMFTPRFYLAGELFGGDSVELKNRIAAVNPPYRSVHTGWSYGADVIPGFMITDTVLVYVRGGGVVTQFNQVGQTKLGWQVGVGGQTNVYRNVDLRAEYIFSLYPKIPNMSHVFTDQFNVGLVYKFV